MKTHFRISALKHDTIFHHIVTIKQHFNSPLVHWTVWFLCFVDMTPKRLQKAEWEIFKYMKWPLRISVHGKDWNRVPNVRGLTSQALCNSIHMLNSHFEDFCLLLLISHYMLQSKQSSSSVYNCRWKLLLLYFHFT